MGDKINEIAFGEIDAVIVTIDANFNKLSEANQALIINGISDDKTKAGGLMGKLFGVNREIASMNIAALICFMLILICIVDVLSMIFTDNGLHMELISAIIPVISLSVGFIFGKGENRS